MHTTITVVRQPAHDPHYRTIAFPVGATPYAFVNGGREHAHHFEALTRFGDAECGCGAEAWSPSWVADGVYGEGTLDWTANRVRWYRTQLPVTRVAALIEPEMPARRPGIPVPPMAYGVLTVQGV